MLALAVGAGLLLAVPAVALRDQGAAATLEVDSELFTSIDGAIGHTTYRANLFVPAGEPAPSLKDWDWKHNKPEPNCTKFDWEGVSAIWLHRAVDGCSHQRTNHDDPKITEVEVLVRFGNWVCGAAIQGTETRKQPGWPGVCIKALKPSAPPPAQKTMSKAEKDRIRERITYLSYKALIYSGLGIVSGALTIVTAPTIVGGVIFAGAGVTFAGGAGLLVLEIDELLKILEKDPPAADFDQVVVPDLGSAQAPRSPACNRGSRATRSACGKIAAALVGQLLAERRVLKLTVALLATQDLLGGARQARNDTAGALQYASHKVLLAQLAAAIAAEERAAAALGATARAAGVRSVRMTPALGRQRAKKLRIAYEPRGLDLFGALRTKTNTSPLARKVDTLTAAELELLVEALVAQGALPADRSQAARVNVWRLRTACTSGGLDAALDAVRADAKAASPAVAAYLQTAIGGLARGRRCS